MKQNGDEQAWDIYVETDYDNDLIILLFLAIITCAPS